ncbi:transmembrane protein 177 [Halictus rubicundus]|uniref:transmembrane protein 177 n=1 Tax=Halictus rubicundus TaxID=77578 RepID=UPI00403578B0
MNVRHFVAIGAVGTSIALTALPHTIYLDTFRQLRTKYRMNQTEEPVKEKYLKRFEQVMGDLKLSDKDRKRLKLFYVYGYDIFSAGQLSSGKGTGLIGIPMNYEYENAGTVDKYKILIQNEPLDYTKQEANDFLESIILSENAQKYAIAREILKLKHRNIQNEAILLGVHTFITVAIYDAFNAFFKLFKEKKLYRFLLGAFVYGAGIFLWIAIKIVNNCERDVKIDNQLLLLGPKYIEGANEFYIKLFRRNMALKFILGDKNTLSKSFMYENYFAWHRGLSIPEKISYFNARLQETEQVL